MIYFNQLTTNRAIRLHQLSLHEFRNYSSLQFELTEKRLLIIGANGVGKSNLLEAVELLGTLRSHRCSNDQDLIKWESSKAIVKAQAAEGETLELEIRSKGGRKAKRNEKILTKQIDLIGPLRCVTFSSLDLAMVRGEPSIRRSWIDRLVQQLEPIYSDLIGRYSKLLKQRSQLWQSYQSKNSKECYAILDAFDIQMALVSTRIHRRRSRVLKYLQPLAKNWHEKLSNGKETLELEYIAGSHLEGKEDELTWRLSIEKQLKAQRGHEERLGRCKIGPHRDEVNFLLNGVGARRFASAGQQRTIILSLKLAELDLVTKSCGETPLLLLDDVLAELDQTRQILLLEAVGKDHQCLVTATHLDSFEGEWIKNSQIIQAENLKRV